VTSGLTARIVIRAFFIRDDEAEPVQSPQCLSSKSGMLCPFAPVVTD
jgi:hypothetical protein